MRDYAKISPTIWRSRKFKALDDNDDARLFYLYLHTCPHGNSVGCFWLPRGYIQADLGWSDTRIDTCIRALCKGVLIRWNDAENVVQIVDFLAHSPIHNDKHAVGSARLALQLPDCDVKAHIINELRENDRCKKIPELMACDTPNDTPMDTGIPTETETETEKEKEVSDDTSKKDPPEETGNLEIPLALDRREPALAVKAWNEMAKRRKLPSVQVLTDPRRKKLTARLTEIGGLDGWSTAMAKIEASRFLLGENDSGWTATFDFLMQPSSMAKLMEGNYDNREGGGGAKNGGNPFAQMAGEHMAGKGAT